MSAKALILTCLSLILSAYPVLVLADDPPVPGADDVVYQPPLMGAPKDRVGGASRGAGDAALRLVAVAPDHMGLTIEASPVVYFFTNGSATHEVIFTINDDALPKPLKEVSLGIVKEAGIYPVSLKKLGLKLEPGHEYDWSVSEVLDPTAHSLDVVASASISRVPKEQRNLPALGGLDAIGKIKALAKGGVWYDAVDESLQLPDTDDRQVARAKLFQSAGIGDLASSAHY